MLETTTILSASTAIHTAILAHEGEIESLDRAIGDGDHYINMKRGTDAIVQMHDALAGTASDDALNKIAMKLLSTIGGASGPLFASFFMSMAKTLKANGGASLSDIAAAFTAGVEAIKHRGKSDIGEKTMLDVLIPVSQAFQQAADDGLSLTETCAAIQSAADKGLASTKDMIATKGRAAGLGERAIGHLDAGAKSCQVMIHAVCDAITA